MYFILGNANRFETEEKCIEQCGNTNSRKR